MFPWAAIGTALKDWLGDPKYVLMTVLGILFVVWLYKGIYHTIVSHTEQTVERTDKTLEIYGALEIHILKVLRDTKDKEAQNNLLEKIGESYPYVSNNLFEELTSYIRSLDLQQLRYCLGQIQEEVPKLRTKYDEKIPEIHSNFDEIFYWIKMTGPQFKAFRITLFWLLIVGVAVLFSVVTYGMPDEQRGSLFLGLVSIMLIAFFYYHLAFNKEYRVQATLLEKIIPTGFLLTFLWGGWIYKFIVIFTVFFLLIRVGIARKKRRIRRQGSFM